MAREVGPIYMPLAREEGLAETEDTDVEPFDSDIDWSETAGRWQGSRGGAKLLGTMVGIVSVAGTLVTLLFVVALPKPQSAREKGNAQEHIQKSLGGFEFGDSVGDTFTSVNSVLEKMQSALKSSSSMQDSVKELESETMVGGQNFLPNLTYYQNITGTDRNNPDNDRNDGNLCPDDEEMHGFLCYKKCSKLTKGKYPIRTSAFACCASWPCTFFNSKFTNPLNLCAGFDVAGDKQQSGCPHGPGDCYENEEYHLGLCYKKCSILTQNSFPYRAAAATCCRYNRNVACLDGLNVYSNTSLNAGGGVEGTDEASVHQPIYGLTEKESHWTSGTS